jgi:phospholipase/carboxylesterase
VSLRNYVAVGPRACCPPDPGCLGYQWRQNEHAVQDAEERVFDSIDVACSKYNVEKGRVFLAGYQCGGTLALRIGLKRPEYFAGAISIGGPFPTGSAPLSRLRRARKLPILMAQGRESVTYPPQVICRELRLYHAAAMHVTLRLYPCGDELTTQMLDDMDEWMMERINGVSESPSRDVHVYPGESN